MLKFLISIFTSRKKPEPTNINKEFSITFTTSPTSEDIYGEIYFDSQILCRLIKTEEENEEVEIEFFFDQYVMDRKVLMKFPLKKFIQLTEELENELIKWHHNLKLSGR